MRARVKHARTQQLQKQNKFNVHKFENCKVYFTKYKKIALLFKIICTYQKKAVLLHRVSL